MPLYKLGTRKPSLPQDGRYWIAPDAQVIGAVKLDTDANIWFGVIARADTEEIVIGARSNIQDGSVLHSDPGFPLVVGEDCTIGHAVLLHGCRIGNNVLIGMGSTIMNGAIIGEGSIVGANALVTEGKVFPPHSMILGAPAKAVRTLDEASVAAIGKGAVHYVENSRRFAAELEPWQPEDKCG
jgi:carbonic anhydrase/acetyltransferase-like protein (isoleucine patch superfamily)